MSTYTMFLPTTMFSKAVNSTSLVPCHHDASIQKQQRRPTVAIDLVVVEITDYGNRRYVEQWELAPTMAASLSI